MTNEQHIENLKKLKSFHNGSYGADIDRAIKALEQEPKIGHWIKSNIPNEEYVCSECGGGCWYYDYQANVAKSRYCPNCGTKMIEPQESDKCSKCEYYINPDYTRCKECGAERSDKE